MLTEIKPTLMYHEGAAGSSHRFAHKTANHLKNALDIFERIESPSIAVMIEAGQTTVFYDEALHAVLDTNENLPKDKQATHPEEKAELEHVHQAIDEALKETLRMIKGPMN